MEHKTINRLVAGSLFLVALVTYIKSLSPTVVFWDVGEFCAAAYLMQVPHPPGAPLFLILARVVGMVPFVSDIAVRMHMISAFASALTIGFLYLISVRFILNWRPNPETLFDKITIYGSASIGSLALTFSNTFWFNAVEAEVYGMSMLFVSGIVWLTLRWYDRAHLPQSDLYLLFIAYLIGLAVGVHLLAILALFTVMLIVYFRFHEGTLKEFFTKYGFVKFGIAAIFIFGCIYPGIVKWLPSMLDGEMFKIYSDYWIYLAVAIVIALTYGVYYSIKKQNRILNIAMLSALLIIIGYSTYLTVYIRANANPPMNENNPSNTSRLVSYLNREQYGSYDFMPRRYGNEPEQQELYRNYTSEWDFFLRFQLGHLYLRYFGWNFVGQEGDWKDAGVDLKKLYAIPLILGIIGLFYHWKKDKIMAFIMTMLFLIMGFVLVLYFNIPGSPPRERDYFYVGSFFVFAMWIGMGVLAIIDFAKSFFSEEVGTISGYAVLVLAFVFVPLNMQRSNHKQGNRSGNYVAWDYSYNLLQSCEKDAILFTNGDNDTFPLWYLQDVEGVRRDIRIVNLSLVNTNWYILQLKHQEPHGAKKVPISLADEDIENIQPIQFEPRTMYLPVPKYLTRPYDAETKAGKSDQSMDTLSFYMPNTLQVGKVKGLRVQDIMVYDIIRSSNWQRPIYFAMTVSDDGKIGLRDHVELQGLAFKLVPRKANAFWANLNEEKMKKHLFTDVEQPLKEPSYGFRWRGLNDSTIYFDEDIRRLMTNYRQAFIAYALYVANVKNQPSEVNIILNRMETVTPHKVIDMDYRLKSDIESFYSAAGNKEKYQEFTLEIIQELEKTIQAEVVEPINQYNPYLVLLQCYEGLGMYPQALQLLERIKNKYSTAQGVDQFVESKRATISAMMSNKDSTQH